MSFFIRVFLRAGTIVAVNSSDAPIVQDVLSEGVDAAIDAELPGDYLDSGALMPFLSVAGGELMIEGVVVPGQTASARTLVLPPQQTVEEWRATAFMPKADFLKALRAAGILSDAEAVAASKGEVPASFATIIATMPEDDQIKAQIDWGAVVNVTRANPFINDVAVAAGVSETTLDAIFGWQG